MKLNLSDNALKVLKARYLLKNKEGTIVETPEQLFKRVATCVAKAEDKNFRGRWEDKFYELMVSGKFLPNSPTLMNAEKKEAMLFACFVLPVEDSVDSIFTAIKQTAIIQKAGGGTGFNFSKLRPKGDIVKTSGGTTSGPIPFIKVFSEATTAIQQGALRRGANMGIMSIEHPDIIDFINIKDDPTQLTNFNLSVGITDNFIQEYLERTNRNHHVQNPRTQEWSLIPKNINKNKYWTVQEIFDLIIKKARTTGEPGLVFLDRINKDNPTPNIGKITGTNPCGEQPLLDYEACTLGSINVSKFFNERKGGSFKTVLWEELKKTIELAIRFLDNTIDVNYYPLPEIEAVCKGNRKIGLGIMGFADLLFKLEIPYNSKEALEFADTLGAFFKREAHKASWELAKEKGCFPNYETSIYYGPSLNGKMRNASVTTIAPTGSISIIANCSGGIEPLFSLVYERNILDGKKMIEVNPIFEKKLKNFLYSYSEESKLFIYYKSIINIVLKKGTIKNIIDIPEEIKKIFVCSHDIEPEYHLKMQEVFQKYIDAGISKTINFKYNTSIEEVKDIFVKSLTSNIKGITVYRDGCREEQPMSLKNKKLINPVTLTNRKNKKVNKCESGFNFGIDYELEDGCVDCNNILSANCLKEYQKLISNKEENNNVHRHDDLVDSIKYTFESIKKIKQNKKEQLELKPEKLPDILPCIRIKQITPFGTMHVKICYNPDTNIEKEIFAQLGKGGDIANSDLEAICRLISLHLRCGGNINNIEKQLQGIGSTLTIPTKEGTITSLADGLSRAIKKYLNYKNESWIEDNIFKPDVLIKKEEEFKENIKEIDKFIKENENEYKKYEYKKYIEGDWNIEDKNLYKLKCPDCSETLIKSEGCIKCLNCGYSQCG